MIPPPPPVEQMPLLIDAAKIAGITYRQADYWCRRGYINATWYDQHGNPLNDGHSGHERRLTTLETRVLHTMVRLIRAGLCPATAAIISRSYIEDPTRPLTLTPGIQLLVEATP